MAQKDDRARVWDAILYPESLPSDFTSIIESWHVPAALSPIHNPDEDNLKQHYHLIIAFSGKKSYDQVLELVQQLGSKRIERTKDTRAMTRYLIHLDNPEKEQFENGETAINYFAGYKHDDFFKDWTADQYQCQQLEQIILDNDFYNMVLLIQYLKKMEYYSLLDYIRFKNAYYVNMLLNAKYQILKAEEDKYNENLYKYSTDPIKFDKNK